MTRLRSRGRGLGRPGEWELRFAPGGSTIGRWPSTARALDIAAVQVRCMGRAVEVRRIREDGRVAADPVTTVRPHRPEKS